MSSMALTQLLKTQKWAVERQMVFAGGFQGRCNKLVDSCYSFWVGAIFPQLKAFIADKFEGLPEAPFIDKQKEEKQDNTTHDEHGDAAPKIEGIFEDAVAYEEQERSNAGFWLYDQRALQNYLLFCAQEVDGGMRDKPEKCVP